jgi:hypothetical protein
LIPADNSTTKNDAISGNQIFLMFGRVLNFKV